MERPNIVLICVDQMRRDCMGIAGHPVVETPNLDMMRWKGWQFTKAYSATPTCIPARAALMTGKSQRHHGRVGYKEGIPWEYAHTMAGELASAGYHTQCVGKMHVYPERNLMGFHHVVLHDGYHQFDRDTSVSQEAGHAANDDYLLWLKRHTNTDTDLLDLGMGCNSWMARPSPMRNVCTRRTGVYQSLLISYAVATQRSHSSYIFPFHGLILHWTHLLIILICMIVRIFHNLLWGTGQIERILLKTV